MSIARKPGGRQRRRDPRNPAEIYEVVHFRDQRVRAHGINTGTAATIAAAYAVAKGREPVSATFVDTALTVHKRLLSHGAIAILLLAMDDRPRGTNPFDNAQVLQNIIKGETPPKASSG